MYPLSSTQAEHPPFARTLSQSYLSKRAKRRVGLSATPVVNRPLDLAGICTALNTPDYLQSTVTTLNRNLPRAHTLILWQARAIGAPTPTTVSSIREH
mgnify:CR=1 FL=1